MKMLTLDGTDTAPKALVAPKTMKDEKDAANVAAWTIFDKGADYYHKVTHSLRTVCTALSPSSG